MKKVLFLTIMLATVIEFGFTQSMLSGTYRFSTHASITFLGNTFSGSMNMASTMSGTYAISGNRLRLYITRGTLARRTLTWTIIDANTLRDHDGDRWDRDGSDERTILRRIDKLEVDLSTLTITRNLEPFENQLDEFPILFPEWSDDIDWSYFNRIRVRARYYDSDLRELLPRNAMGIVSLIYDPDVEWGDLPEDTDTNTPFRAINLMGHSGAVSMEGGAVLFLDKAPLVILFQNATPDVAFIEVTEITFFSNN